VSLFFALDPPQALKEAWRDWQRQWEQPVRWSRAEGIHLTLAFLGTVEASHREGLQKVGAEVASRHATFPLQTAGLGGFPSARKARVLWLGLKPEPALTDLARDLRMHLDLNGLPFDPKPFAPHLTLGRSRGLDVEAWPAPPERDWQASSLRLLESAGGGCYRCVAEWALGS
jgi:2'-5' RNA ligase